MYSPQICEQQVRALYRLKLAFRKPMTVITRSLLETAMASVDRKKICRKCRERNLNSHCEDCFFRS